MTSKSVADFLAALALKGGTSAQRRKGSELDKVEPEVRELAAAGASINEMLQYLWQNHQMRPARSGFAAWLLRRGIGSSGRQVEKPVPTIRAAATKTADQETRPGTTLRAPREMPATVPPTAGGQAAGLKLTAGQRAKASIAAQREQHDSRRSSTKTAAQQFAHIPLESGTRTESSTVDPIANLECKPKK